VCVIGADALNARSRASLSRTHRPISLRISSSLSAAASISFVIVGVALPFLVSSSPILVACAIESSSPRTVRASGRAVSTRSAECCSCLSSSSFIQPDPGTLLMMLGVLLMLGASSYVDHASSCVDHPEIASLAEWPALPCLPALP